MSDKGLEKRIEKYNGDISKVYTELQDEFNRKYKKLIALFEQERKQREVLDFYQRRNNGIVDLIQELELQANPQAQRPKETDSEDIIDEEELSKRIDSILELNPSLMSLTPLKAILANDPNFKVDSQLKFNLFLHESVDELAANDLTKVEKNPQDIELWLRRNHPNLVLSRFKPITFVDNQLTKADSQLDNLNNSLNNVTASVSKKRQKKA